jgi:hypothetical protein
MTQNYEFKISKREMKSILLTAYKKGRAAGIDPAARS